MKRISVLVLVAMLLSVGLSACGGGGGGGAAAAAKSFFDAFAQLDFNKMKDLTCDAQKKAIEDGLGQLNALGSADQLKELLKVDTSGLKFEEKSVSGNNATVVVSGKMKIEAFGQSQEQPVNNEELPMVNEGGKWKVCGGGGLPLK